MLDRSLCIGSWCCVRPYLKTYSNNQNEKPSKDSNTENTVTHYNSFTTLSSVTKSGRHKNNTSNSNCHLDFIIITINRQGSYRWNNFLCNCLQIKYLM